MKHQRRYNHRQRFTNKSIKYINMNTRAKRIKRTHAEPTRLD